MLMRILPPPKWDPSLPIRMSWSDYYQEVALDEPVENHWGMMETSFYEARTSPKDYEEPVYMNGVWYWSHRQFPGISSWIVACSDDPESMLPQLQDLGFKVTREIPFIRSYQGTGPLDFKAKAEALEGIAAVVVDEVVTTVTGTV